jgi:hypothetical protein
MFGSTIMMAGVRFETAVLMDMETRGIMDPQTPCKVALGLLG